MPRAWSSDFNETYPHTRMFLIPVGHRVSSTVQHQGRFVSFELRLQLGHRWLRLGMKSMTKDVLQATHWRWHCDLLGRMNRASYTFLDLDESFVAQTLTGSNSDCLVVPIARIHDLVERMNIVACCKHSTQHSTLRICELNRTGHSVAIAPNGFNSPQTTGEVSTSISVELRQE